MGSMIAWVAVGTEDAATVWAALGVRPSGELQEYPEAALTATRSKSGWVVVVANLAAGGDDRLVDEDFIATLSKFGPTVSCFLCEVTMRSEAAGWDRKARRWSVAHDPENGLDHLEMTGDPPPEFAELSQMLEAQQRAGEAANEDVDYVFDAPAMLAARLTGFHHSTASPHAPFEVLAYAPRPGACPPSDSYPPVRGFVLTEYDFEGRIQSLAADPTGWLGRLDQVLLEVATEEAEFLILEGSDESFMQTAAAPTEDGRLMVEWQRATTSGKPQHFRLVTRPGPFATQEDAPIELVVQEAAKHLRSFAEHGVPAPGAFLMDVTDDP